MSKASAKNLSPDAELFEEFLEQGGDLVVESIGDANSDTGRIGNVKLLGFHSKNGRRYLREGINVSLYEGAPVNLNHGQGQGPRPFEARFGKVESPVLREDGVYGTVVFNLKHPAATQFMWEAKNNPKRFGLSHVARGKTKQVGRELVVESVTEVKSVDITTEPATTAGLHESVEESRPMTLEELEKNHPDLMEAISKKVAATLQESVEAQAKDEQIKTLKEQLDRFELAEKVAKRKAEVAKLLSESGLPEDAISDTFREQIERCETADQRQALIEDRLALCQGRSPLQESYNRPRSAPKGSSAPPMETKAFANRLKLA